MSRTGEHATVVINGAGVAGLTLGNILQLQGVDAVILEKHSREYVEQRQRAGTVDARGVRMFREWGLKHVVEADAQPRETSGFWIDGENVSVDFDGDNEECVFCPQ